MSEARRKAINARLHMLHKEHGELTADMVIQDAKSPESPFHDSFEWNVERAAYQHWVHTANSIINGYRVSVTVDTVTLQAPVFVRSPEHNKRFVRVDQMATERDIAKAALRREADRVYAALKRMQGLAAALGLTDSLKDIDESLRDVMRAAA